MPLFPFLALAVLPPQAAETDPLLRQLGSPRFVEREAASRRLEALGEPARQALGQAATAHEDPEVRRRAQLLMERLPHPDYPKFAGDWMQVANTRPVRLIISGRQMRVRRDERRDCCAEGADLTFALGPARRALEAWGGGKAGGFSAWYSLRGDELDLHLPAAAPAYLTQDQPPHREYPLWVTLQFKRLGPVPHVK